MKLPKNNPKPSVIEPMLPLINVVFLLLIFFMVSGHIAQPVVDIEPPQQMASNPLKADEKIQQQWLYVDQFGQLSYGQPRQTITELAPIFSDKKTLRLIADGRISTGKLEQICQSLAQIGVEEITLITALTTSFE